MSVWEHHSEVLNGERTSADKPLADIDQMLASLDQVPALTVIRRPRTAIKAIRRTATSARR